MPAKRSCILVLGMHRSGTSALTRTLNLLGATVPSSLMPAHKDNEAGYWESSRVMDVDDALLADAGSRWDDWLPFDATRMPAGALQDFEARIADVLKDEFGDAPLIVLKDPRICRFTPIYLRVLESMNVDACCLHMTRNPREVAQSLARRDAMPAAKAALLWLRHGLDAELATRGRNRAFLAYDSLLNDELSTARRLVDWLGTAGMAPDEGAFEQVAASIRPDLRHHAYDDPHIAGIGDPLSALLLDSYRALSGLEADPALPAALHQLDDCRARVDQAADITGAAFRDLDTLQRDLEDRDARLTEVRTELDKARTERDEARTELDKARTERDEARIECDKAWTELQSYQVEFSKVVSNNENAIRLLKQRLRTTSTLANEVIQSKWWRRTRTFRRWSNSIRKRRGIPKKTWPTEADFVSDFTLSLNQSNIHEGKIGSSYARRFGTDGTSAPAAKTSEIPVVRYSDVDELFVPHLTHDEIKTVVKAIAFYLPQFHPFPENDSWWGKGFTEWTNVGKAQPLFNGHYQPHCPVHLGYYDLRVREVMEEQAKLARNYGISGFAYYFYWFAGKLLMQKPLETMLDNPAVDIPFCMIWANENWTRRWDGLENEVLIGQEHSIEDSKALLKYLRKFFEDGRYIKINGRPLFVVYRPRIIPDIKDTLKMWRNEAKKFGFPDLYLVSAQTFGHKDPGEFGFDAAMEFPPHTVTSSEISQEMDNLDPQFTGKIFDYDQVASNALKKENETYKLFPTAMLSWDNTARKKLASNVFARFSLTRYSQWLSSNLERVAKDERLSDDERLVFINAWNEWAEGTHLEPDQLHGYGYLEATRNSLLNYGESSRKYLLPEIPEKTQAKYAVVAHVHYADTWPELKHLIKSMPKNSVDVYVTTTALKTARMIAESMPHAIVEIVDNRGRDIRPFLLTMKRISHLDYRAVCKVHGKKSVYRSDGDEIRKKTLDLLSDRKAIDLFESDKSLGLVATSQSVIPHTEKNMTYDRDLVKSLAKKLGYKFKDNRFVAGSMYWVDPEAIQPLLKLSVFEFDVESGLADGTLAHAVERIVLNLVEDAGFKVITV